MEVFNCKRKVKQNEGGDHELEIANLKNLPWRKRNKLKIGNSGKQRCF
jgi:hypothetical protein